MTDAPIESLSSLFPLTFPIPKPTTHPDLLSPNDLHREEDLLRNPNSFRQWWSSINSTREALTSLQKAASTAHLPPATVELLGVLATPVARQALQRLTYLFEAALARFPTSFKFWKSYLQMRMSYVLGRAVKPKRAGGRKKYPEMREALEDEEMEQPTYEGGLNGVVGWLEWKALVATFERAIMWLPNMPRIWIMYLSVFTHPLCPAPISHTHARRTFDRALRTLPASLHGRIWPLYLLWAESRGGYSTVKVYRRYLKVDPSVTERYTSLLLSPENPEPRPLEAAKLLLSLARKSARGEYTSPEGKSPYQLLGEWLDVVEKYGDDVGLGKDDTEKAEAVREREEQEMKDTIEAAKNQEPASINGNLIRFAGPPVPAEGQHPYDEDEDPLSDRKLNVEKVLKKDGLEVYKDQAGRLWAGLATYWIKCSEFDKAKETFEKGMALVVTVRDFTQIFDAYAEFSESLISGLMELMANPDLDDEDVAETEQELDAKMKEFEELMDRRPFLVNQVLLRRNPNDVQEWEKRVALWGDNDEKVAETYTKALETIAPKKATANFHMLYVNFAKFYETGGASGSAEPDLASARKVLEKATKVNFRTVDELAEIWCEWAEMELRNE
ncbi:pre-mRNA-splicing factor syf1 [Tulasnella sp. 419]|nr:pre-mRNA-splicing factor syf1 [Tulasnella sp. 419]